MHLPPRQQLAAPGKWPVVGERAPRNSDAPWSVTVSGCVTRPLVLSLEEFRQLPQVERLIDLHCVTRWSKPAACFRGVLLEELLSRAQPHDDAQFISFVARSERNHDTSLPLHEARSLETLIALEADGEPLAPIHGGPVRTVTPGRYFYKSLKWLERIELLTEDRLGYWERTAGYHNGADPWREERYLAEGVSKQESQALLETRQIAGRQWLNLTAAGLHLPGLDARQAVLRNADFRRCRLSGACFDGANLTNARFEFADLREATFLNADVEGADFTGAQLAGANFAGASLLAATFDQGSAEIS